MGARIGTLFLQFAVFFFAPQDPVVGALHGRAGVGVVAVAGRALVERHDQVRAEFFLNLHGDLGREEVLVSIDGGAELHAILQNFALVVEGEHLKTAGVGEVRFFPAGPLVQAAPLLHIVGAGPQREVVSVRQNDLRAERFDIPHFQGLHRALGSARHERGRLERPVRRGVASGAGVTVGVLEGEGEHRQEGSRMDIQKGNDTTDRTVLNTMERAMNVLWSLYLSASAKGVIASGMPA